jgi:hypothetical protein
MELAREILEGAGYQIIKKTDLAHSILDPEEGKRP